MFNKINLIKSVKVIIPIFVCKFSILYQLYNIENKDINKIELNLHNSILNNIII